jgi:hypothetical protein
VEQVQLDVVAVRSVELAERHANGGDVRVRLRGRVSCAVCRRDRRRRASGCRGAGPPRRGAVAIVPSTSRVVARLGTCGGGCRRSGAPSLSPVRSSLERGARRIPLAEEARDRRVARLTPQAQEQPDGARRRTAGAVGADVREPRPRGLRRRSSLDQGHDARSLAPLVARACIVRIGFSAAERAPRRAARAPARRAAARGRRSPGHSPVRPARSPPRRSRRPPSRPGRTRGGAR